MEPTMRIAVPREIKDHEYRVGLVPAGVVELVQAGHEVWVEGGAGAGIGIADERYAQAGALIIECTEMIWREAEMIVKVKEPQAAERALLHEGQLLFTYLHLAPDREQTADLIASGATCIAYETVTAPGGSLPLLTPMSEIAGRLAPQVGAHALEKAQGGRGVLLGGVPGVAPADVVVLGGGVSGSHAAAVAAGMGASVTVLDRSAAVLRRLDERFGGRVKTLMSSREAVAEQVAAADLLIGAVLVPGAAAPRLVTRAMLATMRAGAVIVDIAIDQGGCFESSRATTHSNPTYVEQGIVHYCVANMPGAVARTSTLALCNATLPFVLALAGKGWQRALADDPHLSAGLAVHAGHLASEPVALAQGLPWVPAESLLA
jgi:alanine dehydrogenase